MVVSEHRLHFSKMERRDFERAQSAVKHDAQEKDDREPDGARTFTASRL
jgi:hypothetical protein